jgi:FolB domain-containing protein
VDDSSSAWPTRIHIDQLELEARLGVGEHERAHPQRLTVSVTVYPGTPFDRLQDDINQAVNYVELCRTTREFAQGRACRLIETLASELASWLLEKFPLRAAEVEVRKFVLPGTQYVSATVRREVAS